MRTVSKSETHVNFQLSPKKGYINKNPLLLSSRQKNALIGQLHKCDQLEARYAVCYTVEDSNLDTSFHF